MMRPLIVSNDFYVSRYVLSDLSSDDFDILYDSDLEGITFNGSSSKLATLLSNCSYAKSERKVIVFSIENIVALDHIGQKYGKPIVWLWNPMSSMSLKNRNIFLLYVRKRKIQVWTFDREDSLKYRYS